MHVAFHAIWVLIFFPLIFYIFFHLGGILFTALGSVVLADMHREVDDYGQTRQ